MSLQKALIAIGFQEPEASVTVYVLEHGKSTAEDIIAGTHLSRGTVYKALKDLTYRNYIIASDSRPVTYSSTPQVTSDIKNLLEAFYKEVTAKIKPLKIEETHDVLKKITAIFEKNGYAIKDPPKSIEERVRPMRYRGLAFLDKVADGEYSFGIAILDKRKKIPYPKDMMGIILRNEFHRMTRAANCVATYLFVHTDRKDSQSLFQKLSQIQQPYRARRSFEPTDNYGIENKELLCFRTDDNLSDKITSSLQEIHQRRIIVSNMARSLKEKIGQIQELVLLSQEHSRKIDNILLGKDSFVSEKVGRAFGEISDPIRRIRNRETRNTGIFRRKFSEDEVRINQYLDAMERRIYLPEMSTLERDMTELEGLSEKFKPIEYELNDLYAHLFRYGVSVMESEEEKSHRQATINPFVFTEPYEKNAFFVDEESIQAAAKSLATSVKEGLPNFFQIVIGDAGIGKTHAARYIYAPIFESNRIRALYLDCPVNYDLVSGIFQELTQESLYPENLVGTIRELRKNVPSTTGELLRVIDQVAALWKNQSYDGTLLILDELENALPYAFFEKDLTQYQPPLALRQVHEILSQNVSESLGFLICCRRKIYPILKEALRVKNIEEFTYEPQKLEAKHFQQLIAHRYEMWSIKDGPEFELDVLNELIRITQGNTRDVIKYCRELFKFAVKSKLKTIDKATLKKIGSIPLFRY